MEIREQVIYKMCTNCDKILDEEDTFSEYLCMEKEREKNQRKRDLEKKRNRGQKKREYALL